MSYSIDFRRKVISTREEEGLSIRETAKQFRIGPASVSRWIKALLNKHILCCTPGETTDPRNAKSCS
ncbi:IS630 transposase-related protein [Symbiopectobacterium sp. RP]|uniref:IS630 transposase-related protein n=1 Tax=Symbiopectobacterium sp. RP TaxID=3248553 RepID=UPI003D283AC7